jgi:hypothetical protein
MASTQDGLACLACSAWQVWQVVIAIEVRQEELRARPLTVRLIAIYVDSVPRLSRSKGSVAVRTTDSVPQQQSIPSLLQFGMQSAG